MSSRKFQEPISVQSQREILERVSLEFLNFTTNRRRANKPSSALTKVSMVPRTPDQVNRGMPTILNSKSNTATKLTEMSFAVTSTSSSADPQMTSTRYRLTDGQIRHSLTKVNATEKSDAPETMVSSTATPNSSSKFGSYCLTSTQLDHTSTDINAPSETEINAPAKSDVLTETSVSSTLSPNSSSKFTSYRFNSTQLGHASIYVNEAATRELKAPEKSDDLTESLAPSPAAPEYSLKSSSYRLTSTHLDHATTDVNVPATTDVSPDTRVPFGLPLFGSALILPASLSRYQITRKHIGQTVAVDTRNQTSTEVNDSEVNESSSDTYLDCLAKSVPGSVFDSSSLNSTRGSITGDLASDNAVGVNHSATTIGTPPKSTRRLENEKSSSSLASSILIGTSLINLQRTTHDHVAAESSDNESSTGYERSDSGALPQDGADSRAQTPEVHAPQPYKPVSVDMTRLDQDIEFTPLPSPMIPFSEPVVSESGDGQDEEGEATPRFCAGPGPYFHYEAIGCDFLKSCRDIRAETGDQYAVNGWSIQEGSLVIGVDPHFVVPRDREHYFDQLEVKEGNLFLVNRIFGDLWALCLQFSTEKPHQGQVPGAPNEVVGIGFVPLCAVTLAANYGPFLQRCRERRWNSDQVPIAPTNGGRVVPPPRVQSLTEGQEMTWRLSKGKTNLFSKRAYRICEKFRPIREQDHDFQPKVKWLKMRMMFKNPQQAWKARAAEKLEVVGSWVAPDGLPLQSASRPTQPSRRPRNRLQKGNRRHINVGEGFRRFCSWIRGE